MQPWFPVALWLSQVLALQVFKWVLLFLVHVPQAGAWILGLQEGTSVAVISLPLIGHHTGSVVQAGS